MTDGSQSAAKPKTMSRFRFARRLFILVLIVLAALIAWPSPVDPVAYTPPPSPPLTGPLEPNELLRGAEILARDQILGPEDVDVDDDGRIYAATADGRIVRILPDGKVEDWVQTNGRPLGMDFDAKGNLIVCDAVQGLLSIDPEGAVTELAHKADDVPFGFTDDCEIAGDGTIYFSDASDKFGHGHYMEDLLEGRPHGRLLAHVPATGQTRVLLDQLYFANGVAVAPDDQFVLVNETYRYRITRLWLKGSRAGESEVFAEGLPGFPDGISSSPRGTFWVAMFTIRNPVADGLAEWPFLRRQLAKLPRQMAPQPARYGLVVELDSDGSIIRSLHDPGGVNVSNITSVHEEDGMLYFGTLLEPYAARMALPE